MVGQFFLAAVPYNNHEYAAYSSIIVVFSVDCEWRPIRNAIVATSIAEKIPFSMLRLS